MVALTKDQQRPERIVRANGGGFVVAGRGREGEVVVEMVVILWDGNPSGSVDLAPRIC